jgi:hypothetical protein
MRPALDLTPINYEVILVRQIRAGRLERSERVFYLPKASDLAEKKFGRVAEKL